MEYAEVAARVDGIPFMSPELGRRVYDHIRRTRPERTLELGSAHGVSAAYVAAAMEANGFGEVTTVDHAGAEFDPSPAELLARIGLAHRVTVVHAHSSYNWFLKREIEAASDAAGNCTRAMTSVTSTAARTSTSTASPCSSSRNCCARAAGS